MVKAFAIPGFQDNQDTQTDSGSDSDSSSDEDTPLDTDDSNVDTPALDLIPQHESCFAHTLQLVIKDALTGCTQLDKALSKAATLVAHARKSTVAAEILDGERRLQAANKTRWNSQVHMVRSILAVNQDKLKQLNTVKLTTSDITTLKDMLSILEPFEEATMLTQGSNIVSASYIIPCIRGLRHFLSTYNSTSNSKLVSGLQTSMQKRFAQYEDRPLYKLASLLDPRFKAAWCLPSEMESMVSLLKKEAGLEQSSPTQTSTANPPSKKSKLFGFMAPAPSTPTSSEADDYLSTACLPEDTDQLAFWKAHSSKYPCLAKCAAKYLQVPAISAAVESCLALLVACSGQIGVL